MPNAQGQEVQGPQEGRAQGQGRAQEGQGGEGQGHGRGGVRDEDRPEEGQLSPSPRRRLDNELVRRGLARTRAEAQAAIAAGSVLVAGAPADKPARLVGPDEPVVVLGPPSPYVSRGGLKLEAALDRFDVVTHGRRALDAGASTGGFTDCLLQRGAVRVYAVDVGHGQLDAGLRADDRVVVLERVNVRTLTVAQLEAADPAFVPCPLVVADLSFISLRRCCRRCVAPWRPPGPTSSCWSSPSSRRGGRPCPRARASSATRPCGWARSRGSRPR